MEKSHRSTAIITAHQRKMYRNLLTCGAVRCCLWLYRLRKKGSTYPYEANRKSRHRLRPAQGCDPAHRAGESNGLAGRHLCADSVFHRLGRRRNHPVDNPRTELRQLCPQKPMRTEEWQEKAAFIDKLRELTDRLNRCRAAYEAHTPLVSDDVYDILFSDLQTLESWLGLRMKNSPTKSRK